MSKSVARVKRLLQEAGLPVSVTEAGDTRTAEQAAAACGCDLDQIVKSLIFVGAQSRQIRLFLVAGSNRLSTAKASALAAEALQRADATTVRATTGFAIGGVAPVAHLTPSPVWMDPRLMDFPLVWAAAGTPRHVFSIAPDDLRALAKATVADFVE